MKYRPEVDGLRALAVIPVILFHAGVEAFGGGFIGVDVFFVISGYLITLILVDDLDRNEFSILRFYERRARRILPALVVVIAVSIPFAWALLDPGQMENFSKSLVAASLFLSNVFFWQQSDYFSPDAEEMPLLHLWSLAVEEQFYLLFPVFLFLAWPLSRRRVFWLILLATGTSLALAEWGWRHAPVANFFLAPTRAWELLAGSATALFVNEHGERPNNYLAVLGLVAVLIGIFAFDDATPTPSLYTLVPVSGVVLMLVSAGAGTWVGRVLGHRSLVGVGLISYSAYLWHVPVFVFYGLYFGRVSGPLTIYALAGLVFALSWLSWRFVERPFRRRQLEGMSTGRLILMVSVPTLLFSAIGTIGVFKEGNFFKYDREAFAVFSDRERHEAYLWSSGSSGEYAQFEDEVHSGRRILLIGDSMAADLLNVFIESGFTNTNSVALHVIDYYCGNLAVDPAEFRDKIEVQYLAYCEELDGYRNPALGVLIERADLVLIASSWLDWQKPFVERSFRNLKAQYGPKFRLVGTKFVALDLKLLARLDDAARAGFKWRVSPRSEEWNPFLRSIAGADYLDLLENLCEGRHCDAFTPQGELIWFDWQHLTQAGARHLGGQLGFGKGHYGFADEKDGL